MNAATVSRITQRRANTLWTWACAYRSTLTGPGSERPVQIEKEGWYEDPAGRHQYRWFSDGRPTDLVEDASVTSKDPISIEDPELYRSMDLAEPPDTGPLLVQPQSGSPQLQLVYFGAGPAGVVPVGQGNTDPDSAWAVPPGVVEIATVYLVLFSGIVLAVCGWVAVGGALIPFSVVLGCLGKARRHRKSRRLRASVADGGARERSRGANDTSR
jgi:hypothetical protein